MIGTEIAHYRITAKLGPGGMGEASSLLSTAKRHKVAIDYPPGFGVRQRSPRSCRFRRDTKPRDLSCNSLTARLKSGDYSTFRLCTPRRSRAISTFRKSHAPRRARRTRSSNGGARSSGRAVQRFPSRSVGQRISISPTRSRAGSESQPYLQPETK